MMDREAMGVSGSSSIVFLPCAGLSRLLSVFEATGAKDPGDEPLLRTRKAF